MFRKILPLCLIVFLISEGRSIAQTRFLNYNHLDGLSLTGITQIAEDSLGNLWLGSPQGLAKFDGVAFESFETDSKDPLALAGAHVKKIMVAPDGKIWIALDDGAISVYDQKTKGFTSRRFNDTISDNFPRYGIIDFTMDTQNQKLYLVSLQEGIFEMDMKTLRVQEFLNQERTFCVFQDPNSNEHLYYSSQAFYRIHKTTKDVEKIADVSPHKIFTNGKYLYGYGWAGFVFRYELTTREMEVFNKPVNDVNRSLLLEENKMTLGAYHGMRTLNTISKEWQKQDLGFGQPFGIENENIFSLFEDSKQRLWIGTNSGLSVIRPEMQYLKAIDFSDLRYSGICDDTRANHFFACSYHDRTVSYINYDEGVLGQFVPLNNDAPSRIERQGSRVWMLCEKSLQYFDLADRHVRNYNFGDLNSKLDVVGSGKMLRDNNNHIWYIKQKGSYLVRINSNYLLDTFKIPGIVDNTSLRNLNYDGKSLWIGANTGMYRFDINNEFFYDYFRNDSIADYIGPVGSLAHDNQKNELWVISSSGGLHKFSTSEINDLSLIKSYSKADGLPNNRPLEVRISEKGNVVTSSLAGYGIYQEEMDKMLPLDKIYGWKDYGSYIKFFGDTIFTIGQGLYAFEMGQLAKKPIIKAPLIYELRELTGKNIILPKEDTTYLFTHKENNLVLTLGSNDLSFGRKTQYRYRFNQENSWSLLKNPRPELYLSRLKPGRYECEFQATTHGGAWSRSSIINFEIKHPFWQTWWFYLLGSVIFLALIYSIVKLRERNIKKVSRLETKLAQLEGESLRAQMNPHFIFNSLNSIKAYIINNKKDQAADYLTSFAQLIRAVLRNSKTTLIPLKDEIDALNLYMEIENLRLQNKFLVNWKIQEDIDLSHVMVQPLTLQPFIENSIWHGFVNKEGRGILNISIQKRNDRLLIHIEDNGIGRAASREIARKHSTKKSYGISITKTRMEMIGSKAKIEVNDLFDESGKAAGTQVKIDTKLITMTNL